VCLKLATGVIVNVKNREVHSELIDKLLLTIDVSCNHRENAALVALRMFKIESVLNILIWENGGRPRSTQVSINKVSTCSCLYSKNKKTNNDLPKRPGKTSPLDDMVLVVGVDGTCVSASCSCSSLTSLCR
jgi:hypothetical protein